MKQRLRAFATWLIGTTAFIALSIAISRGFVRSMFWSLRTSATWYEMAEISRMGRTVFALCLFWGALYASALAKPTAFGQVRRVFKHLAWSYFFGSLGCMLLARMDLLNYPNFKTMLALRAFVFCGVSLSILCFVLAIAVWIHLAFGSNKIMQNEITESSTFEA